MADEQRITIEIEKDSVLVCAPSLRDDRSARLFFDSVVGGIRTDSGWQCPRRSLPISTLVVRINTFLENKGFAVNRTGLADDAVQREIERKRSFQRTQEAALALKQGKPSFQLTDVLAQLAAFGWNNTKRKLYPHQEAGVVHGLVAASSANFSVPGAGKTTTTLAIAATHLSNDTIDLILVVGPLSCFAPWEKETKAALGNVLRTVRVRGSASERRIVYRSARRLDLLLLSYATAAGDKSELIEVCRRSRVMLVVDESHRVKRFRGGLWAPALREIASQARIRVTLSGTPMPQSGRDLFSQLRIMWPAGELTGPPDDFALRVDRDFEGLLEDINPFLSRTPKQALGLDPYEVHRHQVELTGTQGEIYDLVENQFRRYVEDAATWKDKIDALRRGRPIRMLQAATNPETLNKRDGSYRLPRFETANPTLLQRLANYRHIEVPAKSLHAIALIQDIVNRQKKTGGKVVCWSNFIQNLDDFSALLRERLNIPAFQIDGRVPTGDQASEELESSRPNPLDVDTREVIIEKFLETEGPAVLVTNPASTSESISLHQSCHNAIYLDRTYDCALFLQSIDRIHRLGLKSGQKVEIHILLATRQNRPTIDHLVDQSLIAKEAVMRQLLEGAELKPLEEPDDLLEAAGGTFDDLNQLLRYLLGEDARNEGSI